MRETYGVTAKSVPFIHSLSIIWLLFKPDLPIKQGPTVSHVSVCERVMCSIQRTAGVTHQDTETAGTPGGN